MTLIRRSLSVFTEKWREMTNRSKALLVSLTGLLLVTMCGVVALLFLFGSGPYDGDTLKARVKSEFPGVYDRIRENVRGMEREIPNAGAELGLPLIKIKLSRKDIAHFSDLYANLKMPKFGIKYYAEHNKWRNASLRFEGKKYKIKIKAHGREPTGHSEGRYISYAIKLQKGERIRNANRFSLLVRSRIKPNIIKMLTLADELGLIAQQEELLRVKVNGWDEKLFFLERRVDNAFMESLGKSSFQRIEYDRVKTQSAYKSLIAGATKRSDPRVSDRFENIANTLEEHLSAAMEIEQMPIASREPLLSRYRDFNKALLSEDFEVVEEFLDEDYMARFTALQTLLGLAGHGWISPNFYVFLNRTDGLFYPAISRDNAPGQYKDLLYQSPEKKLNAWHPTFSDAVFDFWLFRTLTQNDKFRQHKYRVLNELMDDVEGKHASKIEGIQKMLGATYSYGLAKGVANSVDVLKQNLIKENVSALRTYLGTSDPILSVYRDTQGLEVAVKPASMSALVFDRFNVFGEGLEKDKSYGVHVQLTTRSDSEERHELLLDGMVRAGRGEIDLSGALSHVMMYTDLDAESDRVPQEYIYTIRVSGEGQNPVQVMSAGVDIRLRNSVTSQLVEFAAVNELDERKVKTIQTPVLRYAPDSRQPVLAGLKKLKEQFPQIDFSMNEDRVLSIHQGEYEVLQDMILPGGLNLVIEAGTTLRLGAGVALIGFGGVNIKGTEEQPVTITSLDDGKPYGSVGFLGDKTVTSHISYLRQSNGSERWYKGIFFSGGFSIHYHDKVFLDNSSFTENQRDDGVNLKSVPEVIVRNSLFQDNYADQIDLDYTNAVISGTRFINTRSGDFNGDGLDVSGSNILVSGSEFKGFSDKGLSVGERSNMLIRQSDIGGNSIGIAVKDLSNVFVSSARFESNEHDISVYMKKRIFGGGRIVLSEAISAERTPKVNLDKLSSASRYQDGWEVDKPVEEIRPSDLGPLFDDLMKRSGAADAEVNVQ